MWVCGCNLFHWQGARHVTFSARRPLTSPGPQMEHESYITPSEMVTLYSWRSATAPMHDGYSQNRQEFTTIFQLGRLTAGRSISFTGRQQRRRWIYGVYPLPEERRSVSRNLMQTWPIPRQLAVALYSTWRGTPTVRGRGFGHLM